MNALTTPNSSTPSRITLHLGEIWHIETAGHPSNGRAPRTFTPQDENLVAFETGALAVDEAGRVAAVGVAAEIRRRFPDAEVRDHGRNIIIPGFVDTHVHAPQVYVMGSYGEQLLGWLDKYTFPEEESFSDPVKALRGAKDFTQELRRHGTTTAAIFSTSHLQATEILFQTLDKSGLRAIVGKVAMDRHSPASLCVSAEDEWRAQETLIAKWHHHDNGRLRCALTPRFAPSCTEPLLTALGELKAKYPDVHIQTHFAESVDELAWVKRIFPKDKDYLAVYERFGLIGARTILAHVLHASETEIHRLSLCGSGVAHCPTSNLFLGSGLLPWERLKGRVSVGLATDVGAGTSFSMWQTMNEAYKGQRLRHQTLTPAELFHLATLGGAQCLDLDGEIGNFGTGKFADFQVIAWEGHPILSYRLGGQKGTVATPSERFFALLHSFEPSLLRSVYVAGRLI